jgi:SAM-dependent methyltransferase
MEHRNNVKETYNLGRNFLASARLNLQHFLWRETCGFNVHPSIPLHKPDLAIAEVGTGTGIWLLELAKQLPSSTKFVGFDISADQFPNPAWLPGNVSFSCQDASKPPPAELQGQFDVVHLRLFTLVVDNNDPAPYIQHCMDLLKPGGHLQWDEYDPNSMGVVRATQQASAKSLTAMLVAMGAQKPLDWIADLPTFFFRQGLAVEAFTRFCPPEHLLKPFTEMLCVAHMEHADLLQANGQHEGEARVRGLIEQVVREAQDGAYFKHVLQVTVGQKAESNKTRIWTRL